MKPICLSVVGRKGSGKSQVIENLISILKTNGWRVGLIKHVARENAELDQPGTDTYRYRKCGAQTVMLSGRNQLAFFSDCTEETPPEKLLLLFEDFDLVLLEGYFLDSIPKLEIHRKALGDPLTQKMENVVAILSDAEASSSALHFAHEQIPALASWIEDWIKNKSEEAVHV